MITLCVIIDADIAAVLFTDSSLLPVLHWLRDDNMGFTVHGGRLTQELLRVNKMRSLLVELNRAGKTREVPGVDEEEAYLEENVLCVSNDRHIIALARISGARTLCSCDNLLQSDFKNRDLVPSPPGKVYTRAEHVHLLEHTRGCPKYRDSQEQRSRTRRGSRTR